MHVMRHAVAFTQLLQNIQKTCFKLCGEWISILFVVGPEVDTTITGSLTPTQPN